MKESAAAGAESRGHRGRQGLPPETCSPAREKGSPRAEGVEWGLPAETPTGMRIARLCA